jgi:predicted phage terminase large subunit-like protein
MADTGSLDFRHLEALERGDIRRLMILAPPGSAKSTYCSIQFPLWWLARHPDQSVLCASNTQDLASGFNRKRRNIALSPQWMTLSGTKLADDLQGAEHFGTEKQGGIKAAGVGSAIVGFRSHLNVLDDPVRGLEEALSAPTLAKQADWYFSEFRTRLVPDGRELIVSTRWAKNDIAGRLLRDEPERWTVLRLPMLADSEDDPLGRAIGEPLWPEHYRADEVERLQTRQVVLWSTQYQQKPLDESGSWVGAEHLIYTSETAEDVKYVMAVDLALSVGRGDYTAIVVAAIDPDRRLTIVHVDRARVDPTETADKLFALAAKYEPVEVLIDDDNASKVFRTTLHEMARRKGATFPLISLPLRGKDKETRATGIRALFLQSQVRIVRAPWNAALIAELLEFPASETDDQIDALSLIGRRFPSLGSPGGEAPAEAAPPPAVTVAKDGQMFITAPLAEMFKDRERAIRSLRRSW